MSHSKVRFPWNKKRSDIAIYLASGYTVNEASVKYGVSERQIYRWKADIDFSAEVDRLSIMLDISGRAERLRLAMRVVRDKLRRADRANKPMSTRDILDWLTFAQSETDGAKIDVNGLLTSLSQIAPSLAGEGPDGNTEPGESNDNET